ncbi:MAG TPA: toll/interleukin-1 receptor domain-containing protein, partial [Plasticicumulans sp.]|nr:toll/interleukin-1 receptor domain-containing protein [Plasticicumulans sp.]
MPADVIVLLARGPLAQGLAALLAQFGINGIAHRRDSRWHGSGGRRVNQGCAALGLAGEGRGACDAGDAGVHQYSHADESSMEQVRKHLQAALGGAPLPVWHDRKLRPGDVWEKEIKAAMSACEVAVLVLSTNFLTSEFIRTVELPFLYSRWQAGRLRVIPVRQVPTITSPAACSPAPVCIRSTPMQMPPAPISMRPNASPNAAA